MFGFFELIPERVEETPYEKIIVHSAYYISLHDIMYKNLIINMYDYETSTIHILPVKKITKNWTIVELGETLFNENSSVFNDTAIYERLDQNSKEGELLTTKKQQQNLLPYLTLHKGGTHTINLVRRPNGWFVNWGS